jgi:hypothetical protein
MVVIKPILIAGVFYASDGTLVHEMSAESPEPESVSNASP